MEHRISRLSSSSSGDHVSALISQAMRASNPSPAPSPKRMSSSVDSWSEKGIDSGYVSRAGSNRDTGTFLRKARNLRVYDKEIPRSTWDRFNDLNEIHGQSLLEYLSRQRLFGSLSTRRNKFAPLSISTKLKVLGESETTAKPW